ncbi:hypothetical protein [Photobacterium halotolerans]|uniref:Uncharacterized protein n=1 Tax=Photobacterium halotolerans TaxID=265726 RepID=A0A7X4WEK6_9GAMM|nr:hypothetical protein [Photobacterium halotolerans]NAW66480.1 hypothetical protein [Photobacterium halotolerans]
MNPLHHEVSEVWLYLTGNFDSFRIKGYSQIKRKETKDNQKHDLNQKKKARGLSFQIMIAKEAVSSGVTDLIRQIVMLTRNETKETKS